jgi:hypothetical protein
MHPSARLPANARVPARATEHADAKAYVLLGALSRALLSECQCHKRQPRVAMRMHPVAAGFPGQQPQQPRRGRRAAAAGGRGSLTHRPSANRACPTVAPRFDGVFAAPCALSSRTQRSHFSMQQHDPPQPPCRLHVWGCAPAQYRLSKRQEPLHAAMPETRQQSCGTRRFTLPWWWQHGCGCLLHRT